MKTVILFGAIVLSGCSTMNYSSGWEHGGRLLEQGPVSARPNANTNYGGSDIRTGTTTYNLPGGSYQANRVGNTVTVIQTSKSR